MESASNRILIVDDNPAIHEDLKEVLCPNKLTVIDEEATALEAELFSDDEDKDSFKPDVPDYDIDDAFQGDEAIKMVEKAEREGRPYALIFMDVRMPPGIVGIQTIHEIWGKHPNIEMVICTAYSDYSWDQILEKLKSTDTGEIVLSVQRDLTAPSYEDPDLKNDHALISDLRCPIQEPDYHMKRNSTSTIF